MALDKVPVKKAAMDMRRRTSLAETPGEFRTRYEQDLETGSKGVPLR
jgi:hypothetical protein